MHVSNSSIPKEQFSSNYHVLNLKVGNQERWENYWMCSSYHGPQALPNPLYPAVLEVETNISQTKLLSCF